MECFECHSIIGVHANSIAKSANLILQCTRRLIIQLSRIVRIPGTLSAFVTFISLAHDIDLCIVGQPCDSRSAIHSIAILIVPIYYTKKPRERG